MLAGGAPVMADLGLSGLASGVDTATIVSQLMALERQKTTRLGYRQTAVTGAADGPQGDRHQADGAQERGPGAERRRDLEAGQTATSSDPAQRRGRPDRRRRHRRPHDPGRPPRVLGAARLLVRRHRRDAHDRVRGRGSEADHGRRRRRRDDPADRRRDQHQGHRPRRRRRGQERPRRGPARAVLAHHRLDLGLHGHERRRARRRRRV